MSYGTPRGCTVDLDGRISNTLEVSKTVSCIKSTWAIPVGIGGGGVGVGGLRLLVGSGAGRGGAVGASQGGRGEEEDGEDGLKGSKFVV